MQLYRRRVRLAPLLKKVLPSGEGANALSVLESILQGGAEVAADPLKGHLNSLYYDAVGTI